MNSTYERIKRLIAARKKGAVLFGTDFRGMAMVQDIQSVLARLCREGYLRRAARGMYYRPKIHPLFGELHPGGEAIARAIAKRDQVRIRPTGLAALNKIGLSTQVPMRIVFLADGGNRRFKVGKMEIRFIGAPPKTMALKGPLSGLIITALEEVSLKHLSAGQERRLRELLEKENPKLLKHDLRLAPVKFHDYLVRLMGWSCI